MDAIRSLLSQPWLIIAWGIGASASLVVLGLDLMRHNRQLGSMMKFVWGLTVLYSGPLGLAIYYYSGRSQIERDSLWRKGFRSVAHCYSGCGAGELVGVIVSVGVFSLGQVGVGIVTFSLAYSSGLLLTVGPLLQDGESFTTALKDALSSESASIVVMEVVAILVDLGLSGKARPGAPLFWSSMVVSLTLGLLAAYPVNVLLIHQGIKEGMHNPQHA